MTTDTATVGVHRHSRVERTAWAFYSIAALGSSIGQIWVGIDVPPWPDIVPWWLRGLLVLPFAVVIDLGGAVSSAFADWRQRLGESAYGWRILSAASVTAGVAINVMGHAGEPYLAAVFGGLGCFAYTVWLLHSAARRRDALRAEDKLRHTAPVFGLRQWWREPIVTRRARHLALEHGYGLYQSLAAARVQLRAETRAKALAQHVEQLIRSRHDDPVLASIAATTLDVDAVAAQLTADADVAGWAQLIGADLRPERPTHDAPLGVKAAKIPPRDDAPSNDDKARLPASVELARMVPVKQSDYQRWRTIWMDLVSVPAHHNAALAQRHRISVRTIQRIRAVGAVGLLDPEHRRRAGDRPSAAAFAPGRSAFGSQASQ